ncbi:uncharacterized protein BDZ99DRAFT_480433 [Mytilinidion resinicola]|uniref:Gfd2/YDR514C-like C-terminal domain-containing protein n=1 Tax=Mytilinidion resinicola TaxID=574789 RepID=A0A6A6YAW6_9PEZI|nr:uncharacterized protein BDZ99DRAFT_480433 [Mytilinidion resinicola]KAF2805769.1 hypothetical protein BDZ99DRAFT_480433 [Mytilinidion resinicola]
MELECGDPKIPLASAETEQPLLPLDDDESEKLIELSLDLKFRHIGYARGSWCAWADSDRADYESLHPDVRNNAVFVAIDFESLAWLPDNHAMHGKITELGLAFLDCQYAHWRPDVKDRAGDSLWKADKSEFGPSEIVSITSLRDTIMKEFRILDNTPEPSNSAPTTTDPRYRPIVLVAHCFGNEDSYLRNELDMSFSDLGTICGVVDAQVMIREPPSLRYMLTERYQVLPNILNLHNAGNDAVYALMLVIVFAIEKESGKLNNELNDWLVLLGWKALHISGHCDDREGGLDKIAGALKKLRLEAPDPPFNRYAREAVPDAEPEDDEEAEPVQTVPLAEHEGSPRSSDIEVNSTTSDIEAIPMAPPAIGEGLDALTIGVFPEHPFLRRLVMSRTCFQLSSRSLRPSTNAESMPFTMAHVTNELTPSMFRKPGEPQLPLSREEGEKLLGLALGIKIDRLGPTRVDIEDSRGHSLYAADKFTYGTSEIVSAANLREILMRELRIFDTPQSAGLASHTTDSSPEETEVTVDIATTESAVSTTPKPESKYRPIILVAHAFDNEDNYLRHQMGISYSELDLYAIIDAQILLCGRRQRPSGLRELLEN